MPPGRRASRSEEHTSELQSRRDLVCRLLLEKKKPRVGAPRCSRKRSLRHRSVPSCRNMRRILFRDHTATPEIYTLSLHDALPIYVSLSAAGMTASFAGVLQARSSPAPSGGTCRRDDGRADRKSTRLNSSHVEISYAVFCLKKKNLGWGRLAAVGNEVFAIDQFHRAETCDAFYLEIIRPPQRSTPFPYTTLFRSTLAYQRPA